MDLGSVVGFVSPVDRAVLCMVLGSVTRTCRFVAGRTQVSREQASPRTPPLEPMGGKIIFTAGDMESPVDRALHCMDLGSVVGFVSPVDQAVGFRATVWAVQYAAESKGY